MNATSGLQAPEGAYFCNSEIDWMQPCENYGTVAGGRFRWEYDPLTDTNWLKCRRCGAYQKMTKEEDSTGWFDADDLWQRKAFWNNKDAAKALGELDVWDMYWLVRNACHEKSRFSRLWKGKNAHRLAITPAMIVRKLSSYNTRKFLTAIGIKDNATWIAKKDKKMYLLSWAIKNAKSRSKKLGKKLDDIPDQKRLDIRSTVRFNDLRFGTESPIIECIEQPIIHYPENRKGGYDKRARVWREFDNDTGMDAGELPKPLVNPFHGVIMGCNVNAQKHCHQKGLGLDEMLPQDDDWMADVDAIDLALIQNHRGQFEELKGKVGRSYDEQLFIDHSQHIDDTDTDESFELTDDEDNSFDAFIYNLKAAS